MSSGMNLQSEPTALETARPHHSAPQQVQTVWIPMPFGVCFVFLCLVVLVALTLCLRLRLLPAPPYTLHPETVLGVLLFQIGGYWDPWP